MWYELGHAIPQFRGNETLELHRADNPTLETANSRGRGGAGSPTVGRKGAALLGPGI